MTPRPLLSARIEHVVNASRVQHAKDMADTKAYKEACNRASTNLRKLMEIEMIDNILFKVLAGEEVSEEEKTRWQAYAEKYQAVTEQYLAKRAELGLVELQRFHFTPGDNFENASVEEVVAELIKADTAPKKELKFDDFTLIALDD